jgi:hypothetical protein
MKNPFTLACVCVLLGCTAQMDVYYKAGLVNVCSYPVNVSVPKNDVFDPVDKVLNPDESVIIMLYERLDSRGFFGGLFTIEPSRYTIDKLSLLLPSDYKVTVSSNGKDLNVDRAKMLKILEKADYSHATYSYEWIIRDSSLCP